MREMKDSGVEWIGEIPKDWNCMRLKFAFDNSNVGESVDKELYSSDENGYIFYTAGANPVKTSYTEFPMWKYTTDNDILLARNGTPYIYLPSKDAIYSDHIIRINIKDGYCRRFLRYCLQRSIESIIVDSVSIATWSISLWKEQKLPLPYYHEQKYLADYLDAKCSKIDEIIEKQQAIIEKLKEYKLSIITEAVTKGINPNVEIKDSGIEWIGYIPKCWNISRLKYLSSEIGDGLHSTPVYDSEGDYYFMNGQNIGNEKLVFSDKTDRLNELEYMKYKKPLLSENTIFITLNGATYGKSSFYNGEKVLLGKSAGYITLKSSENKRYIRYYLQSRTAKIFRELSLCGSTIANLSLKTLNEFIIPLPSEDEQRRIVNFLDVRCKLIDHNIDEKGKIVEKLQEYKKSLIYEVVTGKKEV